MCRLTTIASPRVSPHRGCGSVPLHCPTHLADIVAPGKIHRRTDSLAYALQAGVGRSKYYLIQNNMLRSLAYALQAGVGRSQYYLIQKHMLRSLAYALQAGVGRSQYYPIQNNMLRIQNTCIAFKTPKVHVKLHKSTQFKLNRSRYIKL